MKIKFAILCLLLFSISCKHKSIIDQNIEAYMQKNAHNPESYEPISTTLIDTLTEFKKLTSEIMSITNSLTSDSSKVANQKERVVLDSADLSKAKIGYEEHKHIKGLASFDKDLIASSDKEYRDWIAHAENKLQESE